MTHFILLKSSNLYHPNQARSPVLSKDYTIPGEFHAHLYQFWFTTIGPIQTVAISAAEWHYNVAHMASSALTHKQLETYGCILSTVATDALVLKHQGISIYNADLIFMELDQFH